jgi:MFS family permease
MMVGIGLGAIVAPLLAQRLIAAFGWRMAYAIFGFILLLVPLPVVAALLKNAPVERGLLPDGFLPPQRLFGRKPPIERRSDRHQPGLKVSFPYGWPYGEL